MYGLFPGANEHLCTGEQPREPAAGGPWRNRATGNSLAVVITGNAAGNRLSGGGGSDTFFYDQPKAHDEIADFTRGAGRDKLDIREVIDYTAGAPNLGNFVRLIADGAHTDVLVNYGRSRLLRGLGDAGERRDDGEPDERDGWRSGICYWRATNSPGGAPLPPPEGTEPSTDSAAHGLPRSVTELAIFLSIGPAVDCHCALIPSSFAKRPN